MVLREDRIDPSNRRRVPSRWWNHNHDFHRSWCQRRELLGHEHAGHLAHIGATSQHDVAARKHAGVHVALHDAPERRVKDSAGLLFDEARHRLQGNGDVRHRQ